MQSQRVIVRVVVVPCQLLQRWRSNETVVKGCRICVVKIGALLQRNGSLHVSQEIDKHNSPKTRKASESEDDKANGRHFSAFPDTRFDNRLGDSADRPTKNSQPSELEGNNMRLFFGRCFGSVRQSIVRFASSSSPLEERGINLARTSFEHTFGGTPMHSLQHSLSNKQAATCNQFLDMANFHLSFIRRSRDLVKKILSLSQNHPHIQDRRQFHQENTSLSFNKECDANDVVIEAMNRNARRPRRANHGKRPCSHVRRRARRWGKKLP